MDDYNEKENEYEPLTDEEDDLPETEADDMEPEDEAEAAEEVSEDTPTPAEPEPVPEQRSAYSDAGYVASEDAAAVPKSYYCTAPAEKKEKKAKKERRGMRAGGVIALCLVCVILGGLICGALTGLFNRDKGEEAAAEVSEPVEVVTGEPDDAEAAPAGPVINKAQPQSNPVITREVAPGEELSATDIYYNLATKQVVGVTTEITYTNYFGFTSSGAVKGSGFIISDDGYILTNHHVIADAVKGGYDVQILTYDGTEYIASVVGYEEDNDVAVLKIDATGLSAATIGDSDGLRVGEDVYAVGNPLGELEFTMTDGMVSALDREISSQDSSTGATTTINMFQISAAINEGNSGGPVYNSRGEVIGISTAKYSSAGVEGLGFAIPINDAVKIANDLISDGYVRGKAYMGISVGTVTASAAQYYGLVQGAIVNSVNEGSCAEKAGLKANDIIVAMDGEEIDSREALASAKKDYRAGDSAVLKVYRSGEYLELTIVFDEETPEILEAESKKAEEAEEQDQPNVHVEEVPSGGGMYTDPFDFFSEFFGGYPFGR